MNKMKKTMMAFFAGAMLTFSLASCGPKLMTQAELDAAISTGYETQRATVEAEEDQACQANFDQRVQEKVNMMDMEAQQAAEKTMPAGK